MRLTEFLKLILWDAGDRPKLADLNSISEAVDKYVHEVDVKVDGAADNADRAKDEADRAASVAVKTPYVGTNGNWQVWNEASGAFVDSGNTAKGDRGDTGAKGTKGDTGAVGAQGARGETGAKGDKGIQGVQGAQGIQGLTGADGAKGEKGDIGSTGAQGIQGDAGAKGERGSPATVNGKTGENITLTAEDVGAAAVNLANVSFETFAQYMEKINNSAHIEFNATAGDNTIHFKVQEGGFNCTVLWGDGQSTKAPANGGNIIHRYSTAGIKNIKIEGISFAGFRVNAQSGSDKYRALHSMGRWEIDTMIDASAAFNGCTALKSISPDLFKYCARIKSFNTCFGYCYEIKTIPQDLFKHNTAAVDFEACFKFCFNFATIPEELFSQNLFAETFHSCFMDCSNLKAIPAGLFKRNVNANNFYKCFYGCSQLVDVPAHLFKYNLAANCTFTIFYSQCFYNCTKLTLNEYIFGTEFATRFSNQTVDFSNCFNRSSFAGTRSIAPRLWQFGGMKATKTGCFGGAGNSATSLTNYAEIPAEWR